MKIRKKSACGGCMQIPLSDISLYLGAAVVAVVVADVENDDDRYVVDSDNLDDCDDLRGVFLTFEESAADLATFSADLGTIADAVDAVVDDAHAHDGVCCNCYCYWHGRSHLDLDWIC
jgi:hypothetical protein